MMRKNLILLVTGVFITGMLFTAGSYLIIKKVKPLVKKVISKLEIKRIADIPKAKTPLVICDFENLNDIEKWDHSRAKIELSQEHVISGRYSAKITYQAATGASSVKLEKNLDKSKSDWSRYETIDFDIFNPNPAQERIIVNLKDSDENRAKINVALNPGANNHVSIDIGELWGTIKPSNITQFNLLLWDNPAEKVFYVDNIRLLPEGMTQKKNVDITAKEFLPQAGEKIYATGDYFAFDASKWPQIPLTISYGIPGNSLELAFSGGVPFGLGQVKSTDELALFDSSGNLLPSQIKVLSRWPDQSLKWALVNMKSTASGMNKQEYFLKYGADVQHQQIQTKLSLQETKDEIIVDTGAIKFSISKEGFYLFNKVWMGNKIVSSKGDLILMHNGKEYRSSLDKGYSLSIEESGPVRVCLKASGWFVSEKGGKYCQFITRIYAYEGESYIKIQHTFIYTGYPENKFHYLYNGKRLPKNETIGAVYIKTPFELDEGNKFTFPADNNIMQGDFSQTVDWFQDKYNHYSITKSGAIMKAGSKLGGWLDISAPEVGVTIGVKNFWQQFPKEIVLDKEHQAIITYLWPKKAGELDLKTTKASEGPDSASRGSAFGLGKTHEIFFYFHKSGYEESSVKEVANYLSADVLITPTPQWIAATRVLGRIWPYDKRLGTSEDFLANLFSWAQRHIDAFGWYGMIDFGDTLSWYRMEDDEQSYDDWGWHPIGRWGWFNCEAVGTHSGALIQFLRTGDYKYFNFGANLSRHIMDIDTCHYNTVANDPRLKNVITDAYSRVGSMHRHNGDHWGDRNDETSHTNIYGLLLYYYISGDDRARDVLDEIGSFFLNERITYFGHPDIAPQRSITNMLWGFVNLYELTGDKKYKSAADKWANMIYVGQKNDGLWSENYNPVKKRWEGKPHTGYILGYTLPSLIAYHQLTGNKAIAEAIVKATDYYIKNEEYSPYLDAVAYSYWLTGNKTYQDTIRSKLDFFVSRQKHVDDPIWNGMIYQKAYYARAEEFLYKIPFAFEALTDEK